MLKLGGGGGFRENAIRTIYSGFVEWIKASRDSLSYSNMRVGEKIVRDLRCRLGQLYYVSRLTIIAPIVYFYEELRPYGFIL